jgi:hypothetical protein
MIVNDLLSEAFNIYITKDTSWIANDTSDTTIDESRSIIDDSKWWYNFYAFPDEGNLFTVQAQVGNIFT